MVWSVSINKRFFDHHDVLARLAEFFFLGVSVVGGLSLTGTNILNPSTNTSTKTDIQYRLCRHCQMSANLRGRQGEFLPLDAPYIVLLILKPVPSWRDDGPRKMCAHLNFQNLSLILTFVYVASFCKTSLTTRVTVCHCKS